MQNYQYHSSYLTKRAAKLLQEIPKPEGVDDFTYRRLAHIEFHPLLEHRDYVWLWSRAHEGYFLSPIDPRGARASTAWSLIDADEWNEFQRIQLALIDSAPQALFEGLQPVGWGCATDVLLDFKLRADAAREPHKRH